MVLLRLVLLLTSLFCCCNTSTNVSPFSIILAILFLLSKEQPQTNSSKLRVFLVLLNQHQHCSKALQKFFKTNDQYICQDLEDPKTVQFVLASLFTVHFEFLYPKNNILWLTCFGLSDTYFGITPHI
jgi:hypothetical protein